MVIMVTAANLPADPPTCLPTYPLLLLLTTAMVPVSGTTIVELCLQETVSSECNLGRAATLLKEPLGHKSYHEGANDKVMLQIRLHSCCTNCGSIMQTEKHSGHPRKVLKERVYELTTS